MRKVRVAFFAEILYEDKDGASRTMYQLIRRIPSERFEFLFIYGAGPSQIAQFESVKVPTLTIPSNKHYTLSLPSLSKRRLIHKLRCFAPEIIHIATPSLLGHFAASYAQKNHIPIISIYHTHFISYIDYYFKRLPFLIHPVKKYISRKKKSFYNQCDYIYVPSTSIRKELTALGIHPSRMLIWERGIDGKLFNPNKKNEEMMQRITGNDFPNLLFASRLVWEKNLELLFKIYRLVKQRAIPCNFLIAGDGQARKSCEEEMPEAIFFGQLDHSSLSTLYASSSIFLFPSVSETYGNVVMEAMASGLPCIIANEGGSSDLIQDGVNGFTCDAYDEADFVNKIEILLDQPSLYDQFRMLGLQKSEKLNWDHLATTYFHDVEQLGKLPHFYKLTSSTRNDKNT